MNRPEGRWRAGQKAAWAARATLCALATLGLHAGANAQARFDFATMQLSVPTINVGGQVYRNLVARLDADGRLTILALEAPNLDTATRISAASATAQSSSNSCSAIRPFYWELGDRTQRLTGGSVNAPGNATSYEAATPMEIASATKWLYGAYVAQQRNGALTEEDIRFLTFRSGYTSFWTCERTDTVASCVARGNNGVLTPAHVDRYAYGGGHMEKHASLPAPGMNLGPLDNQALALEMRRALGTDIFFTFVQPQLAGGARSTARDYAVFLRKLLNRQLMLADLLGHYPVCTNPATCPTAINTPVPAQQSWHYSLGHWVEDDPASGDGAYSSAGAFGFYPWIDASKTWYGIVAREGFPGTGADSAACGAQVRKAWLTGVAQ